MKNAKNEFSIIENRSDDDPGGYPPQSLGRPRVVIGYTIRRHSIFPLDVIQNLDPSLLSTFYDCSILRQGRFGSGIHIWGLNIPI